jgi:hypothetical protein
VAQALTAVHQLIDEMLDQLLFQWRRLPEVAAEIDGWDLLEQLDFIEEWPLEEDRLADLEGYVARRRLTPDQLARFAELQRVIEQNRPIIRRLQAS